MYNILLSIAVSALAFGLVWAWLGPIAAVIPALIAFGIAIYLLSRRTGRLVEAEIAGVVPLLQERRIEEAQQRLEAVKAKYGRWQILLEGQIDAQLGMIDYLQMKFDAALPRLQKGKRSNWTALLCIGCIHYRRGEKDLAHKTIAEGVAAGSKEAMAYIVQATLLARDGKRTEALTALDAGVQQLPASELLKNLRNTVANKKAIKPQSLPQSWYQFFPEDLAQQMVMKGRKGGPPPGMPTVPQPRFGARHAPRR